MRGAGEGATPELGTLKGLAEMALAVRHTHGLGRCTPNLSEFIEFLTEHSFSMTMLRLRGSAVAAKEEGLQTHTLLRWLDSGLPAFDLTHGLMAAMLLTDPGDVDADAVRLPFETFALRLPSDFWRMHGHEGRVTTASIVLVHQYVALTSRGPEARPLLSLRIVGRDGDTNVFENREPIPTSGRIGDWLDEDVLPVDDAAGVVLPPDENDHRLSVALRRLVVNVALYIAAHGRGQQLGRRKPGRRAPARQESGPDVWVLGREVKLDVALVDAARTWTDSKSGRQADREAWTLKSRLVVRGHWRNVAHGPRFSLRTLKWIAPYPKGQGVSFAHVHKPEGER